VLGLRNKPTKSYSTLLPSLNSSVSNYEIWRKKRLMTEVEIYAKTKVLLTVLYIPLRAVDVDVDVT
jgi:hypothetical protein